MFSTKVLHKKFVVHKLCETALCLPVTQNKASFAAQVKFKQILKIQKSILKIKLQ